MEGGFCILPACPHSCCSCLKHSFAGIRTNLSWILTHWRPAETTSLWTEQLSDCWPFYWETVIAGLARPQPVSHINKSPLIYNSLSFLFLWRTLIQRGCQIPHNWGYRWLRAAMWELGTKPWVHWESSSALNHWTISLAPVFICMYLTTIQKRGEMFFWANEVA